MHNTRTLYHLIWGHPSIEQNSIIKPRIPKNIMEFENNTITRICTAPTVDDCLTGIGPSNIGVNFLLEEVHRGNNAVDFNKILLPFTVVRFEVERQASDVLLPGKIAGLVPDAFLTQEHWITSPTVSKSVSRLWLVGGNIVKHSLLYNGEKRPYFLIFDSKWSDEARFAEAKFIKAIADVTRTWLTQNRETTADTLTTSLENQINLAENKKLSSVFKKKSVAILGNELYLE